MCIILIKCQIKIIYYYYGFPSVAPFISSTITIIPWLRRNSRNRSETTTTTKKLAESDRVCHFFGQNRLKSVPVNFVAY